MKINAAQGNDESNKPISVHKTSNLHGRHCQKEESKTCSTQNKSE